MKSVFRMFRPKRYLIGIFMAAAFTLCTVSLAVTLATCNLRDKRLAWDDRPLSEFMSREHYSAQELLRQAEQYVDSFLGLGGYPSRGPWNKASYRCSQGQCELQRLELEISIRTYLPCGIEGDGNVVGAIDFYIEPPKNSLRILKIWYLRPIGQGPSVRLSDFTPNMDEVALQAAASLPDNEAHILNVYDKWGNWEIRIHDVHGTKQSEVVVAY